MLGSRNIESISHLMIGVPVLSENGSCFPLDEEGNSDIAAFFIFCNGQRIQISSDSIER